MLVWYTLVKRSAYCRTQWCSVSSHTLATWILFLLLIYWRESKVFFFFYVIGALLVFKRQNVCFDRHFHKYSAQSPLKRARVGSGRCRISPPRFLAECCMRQLNQGIFVLLYFRLFTFSDLYWACVCVFCGTVLFVSVSQVIGCEDRLRNDLYCVGWGVKLYSNQTKP